MLQNTSGIFAEVEVFSQLDYMEKRGSGLGKIIKETSILPTFKEDRQLYFESSRNFFYTTIPNVNYGMDRTALESFANSKQTEPIFRPEDEIRPAEILINDEPPPEKPPGKRKNRPEKGRENRPEHYRYPRWQSSLYQIGIMRIAW